MSSETLYHLNTQTLIGLTDIRENAWHKRAEFQLPWEITLPDGRVLNGVGNHYPGPVPLDHIAGRLFNWKAVSRRTAIEVPAPLSEFTHYVDGKPMRWVVQTDQQAIARDDTHRRLGTFSLGWRAHQYYEWLVQGVANILDDEIVVGSAGLLEEGGVAWVQVQFPEAVQSATGMSYLPYLMATTAHNGSSSTTFKSGAQIVICDNTRYIALGEDTPTVRVPHTANSLTRLDEIRHDLGVTFKAIGNAFDKELEELATTKVSDIQFKQVIEALVPINEAQDGPRKQTMATTKRDQLTYLYNEDPQCLPWHGNALGVVQTFNTWHHWVQGGVAGKGDSVRNGNRAQRNQARALDGTTGRLDAEVKAALADILG